MKNKIAVTSICLFVAGFFLFYSYNVKQSKLKLAIEPIYQENKVDDQAREHLQRGDTFYQKGQLAMAAEEYKLSYSIGGPSKIICGFKLVEVYEKLNRYGDALSFLDEMEKPSWSKDDHAKATEIRGRLETNRFNKTVKALGEGWDNIGIGDSYQRAGRYEEAISAYKKAYEVDPGNGLMSGKLLIRLYEKLSRYDEALSVVDDILKKQPLGDYGKHQYALTRARLLAAKAAQRKP